MKYIYIFFQDPRSWSRANGIFNRNRQWRSWSL